MEKLAAVTAILLVIHCGLSCGFEPTCSRFAYEEATLTKMIKTEIKVEEMEREMKKSADTIKASENRISSTLREMTALSEQHAFLLTEKTSKVETLIEQLAEFKSNTLRELKELVSPKVVIFRAETVADRSLVTNQILVFPKTVVNEGQGYDNKTGKFTAPVTGMYHVTTQLCSIHGKYIHFDILSDGIIVRSGVFYNAKADTCGSTDLGILIRKGANTFVRCSSGYTYDVMYETRYRVNSFSGYLVYRLPDSNN